jgi:hypothetical protein
MVRVIFCKSNTTFTANDAATIESNGAADDTFNINSANTFSAGGADNTFNVNVPSGTETTGVTGTGDGDIFNVGGGGSVTVTGTGANDQYNIGVSGGSTIVDANSTAKVAFADSWDNATVTNDPGGGVDVTFADSGGVVNVVGVTEASFAGVEHSLVVADPACFLEGTRIRGQHGELPVEIIKIGDLVLTTDNRLVPVRWVGRHTVSWRFADPLRVLPIRVKAGALGDNIPSSDLLLSPDHGLLVGGVLIQAGALVNDVSVVRVWDAPSAFMYFHIETDDHSLILAENAPAETFVDNVDRMAFDNWDEYQALYPEARAIVEMHYPRAKSYRQVPRAIRQQIANRRAA